MKKILLTLLPLTLLASACNPADSSLSPSISPEESPTATPSESSDPTSDTASDSSSPTESEEEAEKYALNLVSGTGSTLTVSDPAEDYLPGTEVSVAVTDDYLLEGVYVDGQEVVPTNGKFKIVIPNHDVTVESKTVSRGDPSLVRVADFDESLKPTNVATLKNLFLKADEAEGKFTKSIDFVTFMDGLYQNLAAEVYSNDVMVVDTNSMSSQATQTDHRRVEIGREGNYVYEFDTRVNLGEARQSVDLYTIGEDEEADVTSDEASKLITTAGLSSSIVSQFFTEYGGLSDESNDNKYLVKDLSSVIADDKKSIAIDFTAENVSYLGYFLMDFSATFDGNCFLTQIDITIDQYDINDYSLTDKVLSSDAEIIGTEYLRATAERGYREVYADKTPLSDFAMNDYEVIVSYKQDEESNSHVAVNNTVENSSTLSFAYRSLDSNVYLLTPEFVGAKEEDMIDENGRILEEGKITLLFDNGIGDIKEVEVTAVKPKPITIDVGTEINEAYVGEPFTFAPKVLPLAADQGLKVAIDEEASTADATLNQGADGSYSLLASSAGTVVLQMASTADSKIVATYSVNFIEKPDADEIYRVLTTMTMYGTGDFDANIRINFNDDGTGQYVYDEWGLGFNLSISDFTYTFDVATLTVAINDPDSTFITYTVVTNDTGVAGLSGSTEFEVSAIARVDLSTVI